MSVENVRKFMELVVKDTGLQHELAKPGTDVPKIIALGAARGLDFTAQDIKTVYDETGGELTEEQLEKVAGGFITTTAAVCAVVGAVAACVSAVAAVATVAVEVATAVTQ